MTELIWEGKYDDAGRKVAPLRVALPFQTVETVNESAQDRQLSLDRYTAGRDREWRNRLIWGDKKYVLPSLLQEFAGKVDLIYIDPPFDTGADFSYEVEVGGEDFVKEPNVIEMKAYRDTWGKGLESYLQWFYETVVLLRDLLSETGTIYVHLDWHAVHYAKLVLDETFGEGNFTNEIIWNYKNKPLFSFAQHFPRDYDSILRYARSFGRHVQNHLMVPVERARKQNVVTWDPKLKKRISKRDEAGNVIYDWRTEKIVGSVWDIPMVNPNGGERLDYATQKPEALLERIVQASSNEGDLVLDCMVGSGTTAAVAERLNRRWIACDLGRFAIHTARKRLLDLPSVRPFNVQNLGKYERQLWQSGEFGESAEAKQAAYRRLILDLYHAHAISGYAWLHGVKGGRMVHVGAVDSPVSLGDITQIASEFRRAVGTGVDAPKTNGVDVLGWDFAFELNEVAKQKAAEANIDVRFLRIPHDVMDKRARDQGDIRFFELAALSVDSKGSGRKLTLTLTDFVIPPDDVPEDIQRAITKWEQWIDYWAVDWDNKGDTFHNQWQDYRTRKKRDLLKTITHTYEQPGEYVVAVKVIDILGNDTTKTLKVAIK